MQFQACFSAEFALLANTRDEQGFAHVHEFRQDALVHQTLRHLLDCCQVLFDDLLVVSFELFPDLSDLGGLKLLGRLDVAGANRFEFSHFRTFVLVVLLERRPCWFAASCVDRLRPFSIFG